MEEVVPAEDVPESVDLAGMASLVGTRVQDITWWSGDIEEGALSTTAAVGTGQVTHQTATDSYTGDLCLDKWLTEVSIDMSLSGDHPWVASFGGRRDIVYAPLDFQAELDASLWDPTMPIPDTLVTPIQWVDVRLHWPEAGDPSGEILLRGADGVDVEALTFGDGS